MVRPKSENPRNKNLHLRITETDLEAIRDAANQADIPVSEFVRDGTLFLTEHDELWHLIWSHRNENP